MAFLHAGCVAEQRPKGSQCFRNGTLAHSRLCPGALFIALISLASVSRPSNAPF